MSNQEKRLAALEAEFAALLERVAALEGAPEPPPPAPVPSDSGLVAALRARAGPPYEAGGVRGACVYAGAIDLGHSEYEWQVERPLPGLLGLDMDTIAQLLAALASGPRLLLLRTLLVSGPRTSQQLQEALGVASPGQLYHHLKELLAAGVVEQRGRSNYRIPPARMVPFLAVLMAAYDLGQPEQAGSPSGG